MTKHHKKPMSAVPNAAENGEEDIRKRAYELYEERGREDGHQLDDWLRAEEEIRQKRPRSVAA